MNKKIYIALAVVLAVVVGGFVGYLIHEPKVQNVTAVGDFNGTPRIAQVVMDLTTTTPTTTGGACKLLNSDSTDRIITNIDFFLATLGSWNGSTGLGIASTTFKVATSSGIYDAPAGSFVFNSSIATSTGNGATADGHLYISSTSPGAIGIGTGNQQFRIWTAGSCLNTLQNGTSTNATGVERVSYFVSQ